MTEYTEEQKERIRKYEAKRSLIYKWLDENQKEKGELISLMKEWYLNESRTKEFIDEADGYYNSVVEDEPSKNKRAEDAYHIKSTYPLISMSVICYKFQISEATFRTQRLIHLSRWIKNEEKRMLWDIVTILQYTIDKRYDGIEDDYKYFNYKPILNYNLPSSS